MKLKVEWRVYLVLEYNMSVLDYNMGPGSLRSTLPVQSSLLLPQLALLLI